MSVHGKQRISPHKHFVDEISQASRTTRAPERPAYKGVHWTDTVIDGTKTLDETLVDFTRQWEAEDITVNSQIEIQDTPSASGGKALYCEAADPELVACTTASDIGNGVGTGHELPAGDLIVCVRLSISDNTLATDAYRIGIVNCATGLAVGYRTIKCNEFKTIGTWQMFAVKVNVNANLTDLACFVTWVSPTADGGIDWIAIASHNVPLGDTGITNPNNSTGITNPNQGTGITNPSVDPSATLLLDNISDTSEVEITNSGAEIASYSLGTESDAINMALIEFVLKRGSSGGYGTLKLRVNASDGSFYWDGSYYISADLYYYFVKLLVPYNLSGKTLKVWAQKDSTGSVWVYLNNSLNAIRVHQYKKHTHIPNDPQHTHIPSDPQHTHIPTDPSHEH